METQNQLICDTDVIIEFLKGRNELDKKFENFGYSNLSLSSISIMELYIGAFNKKEIKAITQSLKLLQVVHITEGISLLSIKLIEKYSKSHGLQLPDSIIAATALENNLPLFTFNGKDFKYISGIKLKIL